MFVYFLERKEGDLALVLYYSLRVKAVPRQTNNKEEKYFVPTEKMQFHSQTIVSAT